jgi:hypothetical protein
MNQKKFLSPGWVAQFIGHHGFALAIVCLLLFALLIFNPWRQSPLQIGESIGYRPDENGVTAVYTASRTEAWDFLIYGRLTVTLPAGSTVLHVDPTYTGVIVTYTDANSVIHQYRWGTPDNSMVFMEYRKFRLFLDLYQSDTVIVSTQR